MGTQTVYGIVLTTDFEADKRIGADVCPTGYVCLIRYVCLKGMARLP